MTDRPDNAQLHDPPGQQPQRPVGIPRRRRRKTHRDHLRLLLAIQQLRRRIPAFDPVERLFKATLHQMLTDIFHRFGAAAKRLGDPPIRPVWPIGIGFEQNLRPPNFLAGSTQLLNHLTKIFTFLTR
jgi:hypothetical protein